jgi:hypothetical protein
MEVGPMPKMSPEDYEIVEKFVIGILTRLDSGEEDLDAAKADILHVLTAWDNGSEQEIIPYMKMLLDSWKTLDA